MQRSITEMHYKLQDSQGCFAQLNDDCLHHVVAYCTIADLGRLTCCSVSSYHDLSQDIVWKHRVAIYPRILDNYPKHTPLKKLVAASLYRATCFRLTGSPPLNMHRSLKNWGILKRQITNATHKQDYHQQFAVSLKHRRLLMKSKLHTSYLKLASYPMMSNQWLRHYGKVSRRLSACRQIRTRTLWHRQMLNYYSDCLNVQLYPRQRNYQLRSTLHDAYTPYLRYYWFHMT